MPLFRRSDGTLVKDIPATRRIMPFLMKTRASAAVYFEQTIDVTRAMRFLEERGDAASGLLPASGGPKATFFHVFSWAAVRTLAERPRLNRFTSGVHTYQRNAIELAFSAKKKMSDDAPLSVVKRAFDPAASFEEHVAKLTAGIAEGRSTEASSTDRELSIFLRLPAFLLRICVSLALWLDSVNLLPSALTKDDPLYCSVFIANLGSVGLDAAYHHLYEWGNCPIFAAVGRVRETAEGRKVCTVRYTFDERIEDGLYCARALQHMQTTIETWKEAPALRQPPEAVTALAS